MYIPPNLTLEVVLPQQILAPHDLTLDVVLCAPDFYNVAITVSGVAVLEPIATLSLSVDKATEQYVPPPLSVLITLNEQLLPAPLPLDVILCRPPSNGDDVNVAVIATAQINAIANIGFNVSRPEPAAIIVDAIADITPTANTSINVEVYVVGVIVSAIADIQPKANLVTSYDPNVFRGAIHDVSGDMQQSKLTGIDKQCQFESNKKLVQGVDSDFQQAKLIGADKQAQFEANIKLETSDQVLFESAKLIGDSSSHKSDYNYLVGSSKSVLTENAKLVGHSNWYSFEAMLARQTQRKVQGEYSYLDAIMRHNSSEYSKRVVNSLSVLTETARLPRNTVSYLPPPLTQTVILKEQIGLPHDLSLAVILCAPSDFGYILTNLIITAFANLLPTASLALAVSDEVQPQPSTGVIFVTNSVALTRSDDGREIKMFSFNVGIDANSYAWSFSANVPLTELSKVNTAIEQRIGVDFECNGNVWRFILDGCDDSISFGESSLTIKGKSRAMLLANPYASQRGFKFDTAMSARQIAESELNRNGVPSGFTLDWQLAGVNGWNVPANTYSYTGKTPINSLQWIAEAAGGFINADMSADIIHVLEQYPIKSWEWAQQTLLLTLPQSLITSRSRSRVNKPSYNGVLVYGEREGSVGALIKRTGTAGGYQPPMVTSDLITTNAAARSRGIAVLSDTGDMANVGISMPLHADFGVLKPSTLIGINDGESWIGMVRGTSISGKLGSNQSLEIEQTLDVERHFDKG